MQEIEMLRREQIHKQEVEEAMKESIEQSKMLDDFSLTTIDSDNVNEVKNEVSNNDKSSSNLIDDRRQKENEVLNKLKEKSSQPPKGFTLSRKELLSMYERYNVTDEDNDINLEGAINLAKLLTKRIFYKDDDGKKR